MGVVFQPRKKQKKFCGEEVPTGEQERNMLESRAASGDDWCGFGGGVAVDSGSTAACGLEPIPEPSAERGTGTFCSEDSAK
jgi:hypothetical protein